MYTYQKTLHSYTPFIGYTECSEMLHFWKTATKISITGHSTCVTVGHFFICLSRVQSEHYESSWTSSSPVDLIHQRLIFCFDLCCLPLVLACLESPSHCERPGPSVSFRSLYEQERRFHGSIYSLRGSDNSSVDLRSLAPPVEQLHYSLPIIPFLPRTCINCGHTHTCATTKDVCLSLPIDSPSTSTYLED